MTSIAGYGRYKDDPQHVGCPRAKTDMTPCIARDGHLALTDPPESVCVGCGEQPGQLLLELTEAQPASVAARVADRAKGPESYADVLRDVVCEATA